MPMRIGDAIPKFDGATEWLNELQETADDYVKDAPTIVYFGRQAAEFAKRICLSCRN
ncbi:MAG: hypothetical protein HC846_11530 [Blastocatellia bacterium]|nr:hypothetical protein [Blastocatellia bacterium]